MRPTLGLAFASLLLLSFDAPAGESREPRHGSVRLASTWHYRPIRDVAARIIERYPTDRYHYVGVGRGPAAFMAMLQAMVGAESASNLPLSYLRNLQPPRQQVLDAAGGQFSEKIVQREENRARTYTSRVKMRLFKHLRYFLPNIMDAEGQKTMLFIDYADTGVSMINLKRELDNHNASLPEEQRRKYAYLGLAHDRDGVADRLRAAGVETLDLRGRAFYVTDVHLFKHLAEYAPWSISNPPIEEPEPYTRRIKRSILFQNVIPSLNRDNRGNRDMRDIRRINIAAYRAAADFYDLREAFAAKLAADPTTRPEPTARRFRVKCARALDGLVDWAYQVAYRKK